MLKLLYKCIFVINALVNVSDPWAILESQFMVLNFASFFSPGSCCRKSIL